MLTTSLMPASGRFVYRRLGPYEGRYSSLKLSLPSWYAAMMLVLPTPAAPQTTMRTSSSSGCTAGKYHSPIVRSSAQRQTTATPPAAKKPREKGRPSKGAIGCVCACALALGAVLRIQCRSSASLRPERSRIGVLGTLVGSNMSSKRLFRFSAGARLLAVVVAFAVRLRPLPLPFSFGGGS